MAAPLAVVYHEEMLEHRPPGLDPDLKDYHARKLRAIHGELVASGPWKHPERPERLTALLEVARELDDGRIAWPVAARASEDMLSRVHTRGHLARLEALRGRHRMLSLDTTAISPGSVDAAARAAGAAAAAVDAVCTGEARSAFALVRPPGHHAAAGAYSGFCLINNVAVAARHARAAHGIERVLILDWDIHHGNGTASIFAGDADVLFFDLHRAAPYYPGTGALEDTGKGRARGTLFNVPLSENAGDRAAMEAIESILVPAARRFRPGLVLVSAGFDGTPEHLACRWSTALYAHMTRRLMALADELCAGRLAMVLEGGYHLDPMRRAFGEVLRTMLEPGRDLPALRRSPTGLPDVRAAREFFAAEGLTAS